MGGLCHASDRSGRRAATYVATVWSSHNLQPPECRPYCLEAMTACRGSFAAPSGTVPGDDKVDPEQVEGPDLVSDSSLEVLPAII
jgi:hypothetical protein